MSKKKSSTKNISPDSSDLNFCPLCQIPLHFLKITGDMHLMRCESNSWEGATECPSGINCFNSDFHHYWDYTHATLSQHRSLNLNTSKNSEEAIDEQKEKHEKKSPRKPKATTSKKTQERSNTKRKHKVLSESDSDDDFKSMTQVKNETKTSQTLSSQTKHKTKSKVKKPRNKQKVLSDNETDGCDSGVTFQDTQTSSIKYNTEPGYSSWTEELNETPGTQEESMGNQIDERGEVRFGHFLYSNSQDMFSNYENVDTSSKPEEKYSAPELQESIRTTNDVKTEYSPTKCLSQEVKYEEVCVSPLKLSPQDYEDLPTPSKFLAQELNEIDTNSAPGDYFNPKLKQENETSQKLQLDLPPVRQIQFSDSSDDDCEVNSETGEMLYTEKFENDENSLGSNRQQQVQDDPLIVSEDIKKESKKVETIEAWKKILSNKQKSKSKERNPYPASSYTSEPTEARFTSTDRAPFYKLIPDTDFVVDGFKNGPVLNKNNYFLSHFHYDHYIGLNKHFSKTIHCSTITAELLKTIIRIDAKYIRVIDVGESKIINQVEVTALDANHCPGALMFVFKTLHGNCYLHVGDFRAEEAMQHVDILKKSYFDKVYLDTTYCDPHYTFPPQKVVIDQLVQMVEEHHKKHPKTLYICGSYTIGKEKVYISILEKMKWNIYVESNKKRILKIINDATINNHIVDNAFQAKLHVIGMSKLNNIHHLMSYYESYQSKYDKVVAIKPTGWVYNERNNSNINIKKINDNISVYEISYSEHSSFLELCTFVKFLQYKQIVCTVNVKNSEKQVQLIESYVKKKLGSANQVTNTLNSYFKNEKVQHT